MKLLGAKHLVLLSCILGKTLLRTPDTLNTILETSDNLAPPYNLDVSHYNLQVRQQSVL